MNDLLIPAKGASSILSSNTPKLHQTAKLRQPVKLPYDYTPLAVEDQEEERVENKDTM